MNADSILKNFLVIEMIHTFERFNLNFMKADIHKKMLKKYKIIEDNIEEIENVEIEEDVDKIQNFIWTLSKIIDTIFKVNTIDSQNKVEGYIRQTVILHEKLLKIMSTNNSELIEIDYEELKHINRSMKCLIVKL